MNNQKEKTKLSTLLWGAQAATLARWRRDFHPVLRVQVFVCLLLFGMVLICRAIYPVGYLRLQQGYYSLFESSDYTPSVVRFVQQAAEVFSMQVQAEEAPSGFSLVQYSPEANMLAPVEQYYVSSGYGWREDPFTGARRFHGGVDFASAEGMEVYAAMDGVVVQNYLSNSYGNCICMRHADGSVTLYAHLQYAFARVGEEIVAGTQIGTVGQTGAATGAHLHFEVRVDNVKQDPSVALGLSELR